MNALPCERENELLDALQRGFLPDELRAHVSSCASCNELHAVAGALLDERVHAIAEAPVPSAATMWWRIRMRQQREVEVKSRRALFTGQAATITIALMLVAALFGFDVAGGMRELIASLRTSVPLVTVLAIWFVLAPVAGYVAIRQK